MNKVRKFAIVMLLILSASIFMPLYKTAMASGFDNSAYPDVTKVFSNKNHSVYLTKYRPNYALDMKDSNGFNVKQVMGTGINTLANVLFRFQTGCTYILICVVYYSFTFSFADLFSDQLKAITDQLNQGLFNQLSNLCIATIGIYFCVKLVRNQKTQIITALAQTIIVLVLAFLFIRYPTQAVKTIDTGSDALSNVILSGTYKGANGGKTTNDSVIAMCDNLWVMFVHTPWEYCEFGDTTYGKTTLKGNTLEDRILSLPVDSDERQEIVNNISQDDQHFGYSMGGERILMILMYTIPMLVQGVLILVLCSAVLIYKFLTIVVAATGTFIFLLALIPWFGFGLVKDWFMKMVSYGSIKIILSFVVAILFIFSNIIFGLSNEYGYLMTMFIQLLIFVGVYFKRDELFGLLTRFVSMTRSIQYGPQAVNKHIRRDAGVEYWVADKGANAVGSTYNGIGGAARNLGNRLSGISNTSNTYGNAAASTDNNSDTIRPSAPGVRRNSGGNSSGSGQGNNGGLNGSSSGVNQGGFQQSAGSSANQGSSKQGSGLRSPASKGKSEFNNVKGIQSSTNNQALGANQQAFAENDYTIPNQGRHDMLEHGSDNTNIAASETESNDLKGLKKLAEELLEYQYEQAKRADEEKSEKLGKSEPEYSDYVKKVMSREERNNPRFESRELADMMNIAQRVKSAGGSVEDIKDYLNKGSNEQPEQLIRPKGLTIDNAERSLYDAENKQTVRPSMKLRDEFNQEFGKQYDESFFNDLMKKYGENQVMTMQQRMRNIKDSGGTIENPAGYLVKGLKNNELNNDEPTSSETANIILERRSQRDTEAQAAPEVQREYVPAGSISAMRSQEANHEDYGFRSDDIEFKRRVQGEPAEGVPRATMLNMSSEGIFSMRSQEVNYDEAEVREIEPRREETAVHITSEGISSMRSNDTAVVETEPIIERGEAHEADPPVTVVEKEVVTERIIEHQEESSERSIPEANTYAEPMRTDQRSAERQQGSQKTNTEPAPGYEVKLEKLRNRGVDE